MNMNGTAVEIFVPNIYCNYGLEKPKHQTRKPRQTFDKILHSLRPFSINISESFLVFFFHM